MKRCTQCKVERELEDFAFKSKTKGIRQACCKECQRVKSQSHYRANKASYIARNERVKDEIRAYVNEVKSQPCQDCQQSYPPRVMDFHHPNDDKLADVSDLVNFGFKRLQAEIAKCVLLCANCHRLRH